MAGIASARPRTRLVRRTITRPPDAGGEDHEAVSPARFETMRRAGAFCLHWTAHGLHYGIPAGVLAEIGGGHDCLANLSRRALPEAAAIFDRFLVLNITASPETLAARLAGRGRETPAQIRARLNRAEMDIRPDWDMVTIRNDGALAGAVTEAVAALDRITA